VKIFPNTPPPGLLVFPRMDSENTPASPQKLGLFWESELAKNSDGTMTVKAVRPVSHMSRRQAAKAIGCSEWTVSDLFRLGHLKGYKPGARVLVRKDGRASNAALRICSESVLAYKQRQEQAAKDWLDAQ
jgi:hypothetical protein